MTAFSRITHRIHSKQKKKRSPLRRVISGEGTFTTKGLLTVKHEAKMKETKIIIVIIITLNIVFMQEAQWE